MRELSEILSEKASEVGGMAKLGKALRWGSEKNPTSLITQYIKGKTPSIEFAVRWKEVFNENLIDLMTENSSMVEEPIAKYGTNQALKDELSETRKKLITCMEEKLTPDKK